MSDIDLRESLTRALLNEAEYHVRRSRGATALLLGDGAMDKERARLAALSLAQLEHEYLTLRGHPGPVTNSRPTADVIAAFEFEP